MRDVGRRAGPRDRVGFGGHLLEVLEVYADPGRGLGGHLGLDEPGAIALAVTPNLPSSIARVLVNPCMPALAAE